MIPEGCSIMTHVISATPTNAKSLDYAVCAQRWTVWTRKAAEKVGYLVLSLSLSK